MRNIGKSLFLISILSLGLFSCIKDLDTIPLDPNITTSANAFDKPEAYKQVLAKLYAGLAVSGQEGPAGKADISGIDEGFGQYMRGFFYHQELTTDEALIGWNDQTIKNFHGQNWTSGDGFTYAFYSRVFYQISQCNEFLRQTSEDKLTSRGVDAALKAEIQKYRDEARFLRALSYWHGLDVFRNIPFATENDPIGAFFPPQATGDKVYAYIESELLAIEPNMAAPRANEYARADKAAVWMLLAKLYQNAQVYAGKDENNKALDYAERVINANYELDPVYQNLFLADNHNSKEMIFPIAFDGIHTRTYGGMTFIIRAGIGGSMDPLQSGVISGWGGTRTTSQLVDKFPKDLTGVLVAFNAGKSYPKIYIPGSFQEKPFDGLDAKNALTSPKSNNIFEGYRYFENDNTELVVMRFPDANLSGKLGDNGADGTLETNGTNIVVAKKGLYYIKVDLAKKTYEITPQALSISGTATPGGVGSDSPLSWKKEAGYLVANLNLNVGDFVFRTNNRNTLVYGDSDRDGILEVNGGAIKIEKSGSYEVRLDLTRPDYTYELRSTSFDRRGLFYTKGQSAKINDVSLFTDGYAVTKFRNVTSKGVSGQNNEYPDTDFPMFRLADAYLIASECLLRGAGGGDKNKAVQYFNKVRERAYTGQAGNLSAGELTLDVLLDERAREFYWECHRRTDLIRFGQFSDGDYLWDWKGNSPNGAKVPSYRNIFPIPASDINTNPNLKQNPGY